MGSTVNTWLLAADKPSELLQYLQANPGKASEQDDTGYSLVHAAASYNHLDLLRALVRDFNVDVNILDNDGETALYVAETVECAKVLVEELHANILLTGNSGDTARERITEEGDFPQVAVYLRVKELEAQVEAGTGGINDRSSSSSPRVVHAPPPLPDGVTVDIGTMAPEDAGEVVDPEFKRRIDELAAREDFQTPAGQQALRQLVMDAIRGENVAEERNVRPRTE
jgi:hypothetical protein